MKLNIDKVLINSIRASSLLFLTAGNSLAAANVSSTDVVDNLVFFCHCRHDHDVQQVHLLSLWR